MGVRKRIISTGLILLSSILIGFSLMILCYSIPTDGIRENVRKTIRIYQTEGNSFQFAPGHQTSKVCGYTVSIMLNQAMYEHGKNISEIIQNALLNPRYTEGKGGGPAAGLITALKTPQGKKIRTGSYPRYWHGHQIFLKPLLSVFTFSDIRILNMFLQTVLFVFLMFLLYQKGEGRLAIPFFVLPLILNPIACALSPHLATVYYITLISCIIFLKRKIYDSDRYFEFFLLVGIITVFFDFLTYPLITLGVPLILFILLNEDQLKTKMQKVVGGSVAWAIGYIGMWAGKWVLASSITKKNVFIDAFKSIKVRVGTDQDTILKSITSVIKVYNNHIMYLFILVLGLILLFAILYKKYHVKIKTAIVLPLLLISTYPFIWWSVIRQHSIAHPHTAHRIFIITILALIYGVIYSLEKRDGKNKIKK